MTETDDVITLGGGCFWCLEAVFDQVEGAKDVVSGYAGGFVENPTYQEVCSGGTGHAEVVQVRFDPAVISLQEILGIFFSIHDPTTLNRQGNDIGPQYRSGIFYHTAEQAQAAREYIRELSDRNLWGKPIVTEVSPVGTFYPAEDYHQEYFKKNPYAGYCQFVVAPKVKKFKAQFAEKLRK